MGPDLQIVTNSSHHLVVSNPEMLFWPGTYIFVVFEIIASATVAWLLPVKARNIRTLFYLIPLTGILILLFAFGWTNTLDIDWDAGTAVSTNRFLLGFSRTSTMATGNIEHAIIDDDRIGPRIALALKDGGVVLPLGTISMFKPSQYAVVEAINDGLRGRASGSSIDDPSIGAHVSRTQVGVAPIQKGSNVNLQIAMNMDTSGGHAIVHVTWKNTSETVTYLFEPWQLFRSRLMEGSLLGISQDGQKVNFLGPMVKRRASDEKDLVRLAPGQSLQAQQDITTQYKFAEGTHVYSMIYSAFVQVSSPEKYITVHSPPVTFTLVH